MRAGSASTLPLVIDLRRHARSALCVLCFCSHCYQCDFGSNLSALNNILRRRSLV